MRQLCSCAVLVLLVVALAPAQQPAPAASSASGYTLTVIVEGVDERDGNVGVLVFNSSKGWAEDRTAALRDITVPAHPGTVKAIIPIEFPRPRDAVMLRGDPKFGEYVVRIWELLR